VVFLDMTRHSVELCHYANELGQVVNVSKGMPAIYRLIGIGESTSDTLLERWSRMLETDGLSLSSERNGSSCA
jgi:hypothetical protein